jgi:3-hydroxyacyl-CoA dehydrogenase/enoyl-CoA hydratase/3-hydroxybutyryl-CoA epimerase
MAVPDRQLKVSAQQILIHGKKKKPLGLIKKWPSLPVVRQLTAKFMRSQLTKKINQEHYPAPYALLSTWENFSSNREQRFFEEANSVTDLFANSPTAKELVRVFGLQERMKSLAKQSHFKPKHVHVIGAGVMGGDIAAWCAMQGFHVTLQDREAKYIAPAIKRAHALYDKKLRAKHIITAAKDRLVADVHGDGVRKADVIIEAIYENLEAKQALYASLEPNLSEHTILATNTSSIPLEDLAANLKDPTRLLGLHFFNPVAKMQLVEIIFAQHTNQHLLDNAASFVKDIKRLPLPVKSSFGFLVNRILMPYLMEAITMVGEGVAPEEIDHAAVSFGMPMGPIELADVVGLDICNHVGQVLAKAFNLPTASILQRKIDRGDLGKKTGYGFYAWHKGKPVKQKRKDQNINSDVQDRLMLSFLNEAMKCHQEKLVADDDLLDAGIIFGTGFAPFRGGPMQYIRTKGASVIHDRLLELVQLYGDRFTPSAGWQHFD